MADPMFLIVVYHLFTVICSLSSLVMLSCPISLGLCQVSYPNQCNLNKHDVSLLSQKLSIWFLELCESHSGPPLWEQHILNSGFSFSLGYRRQWHPTPVLLPGKSHGRRSLVGCSPWGRQESDTTERFHFHFSLSCIGEGNGNSLQCSCLENPRDGGAWWAAVYGVAQIQTRLKQLTIHRMRRHIEYS